MLVWGVAFGLAYALRGRPRRAAALIPLLAVSHWVLDAVSHRPDVPILPAGGPRLGLGLWNSLPLTLAVEWGLFLFGVWAYARGRTVGRGFWALIGVLGLTYLANVFGPPPPSVPAIAISMILLVPLVWWWGNRVAAR